MYIELQFKGDTDEMMDGGGKGREEIMVRKVILYYLDCIKATS